MAISNNYQALTSAEINSNETFWGATGKLGAGLFFARLVECGEKSIRVMFNHGLYSVKLSSNHTNIKPGDIIKVVFTEADKSGFSINLDGENVQVLVHSQAESLKIPLNIEVNKKWLHFISLLREFFIVNNFIEFRTPTLVPSPGIEEHIDVFKTEFIRGSLKKQMYLPTSPEFHLKKALSLGWNQIFEIKDCFRNNEDSPMHQPEFTMLEWYRAYSNLEFIVSDTKKILLFLSSKLSMSPPLISEVSVANLFKQYLDFELTVETTKEDLEILLQHYKIAYSAEDTWDDLYFRIFIEKIEPSLGQAGPLLVTKYPPSQAALARLTDDGWADRFELYWKGIEIANAFHELNDPDEQRARFQKTNDKRIFSKKEALPIDEDFLQALKYGLPPSGGIALGVERLFMCFYDIKDIGLLRGFPL